MPDTVLAIFDGNNHCIRNGMSPGAKNLATSAGNRSGMLFQSIMSFISLYQNLEFEFGIFTFDNGGSDLRKGIRPTYKANRETSASEQFKEQFKDFQRFLELVSVPVVQKRGVEADDLIAAIAWKSRGIPTTIITADHDLHQLVGPNVSVFRPASGAVPSVWYDQDAIEVKYQLKPVDLPAMWSLMGDGGDGIEGIPKVGPKTATKIIKEFNGDLEDALAHSKCVGFEELVRENYSMIKLDGELFSLLVPDDILVPFQPGYPPALRDFLAEFEFHSLIRMFDSRRLWKRVMAG